MFRKKKAQINELFNRIEKLEKRERMTVNGKYLPPHLKLVVESRSFGITWYTVNKVAFLEWENSMLKDYLGIRFECKEPESPECKIIKRVKNEEE